MATLQERIREYLGSQADTPAARSLAQTAESMYADELGAALGGQAMGAATGAMAGRGATTPAEREYLNQVLNQTRQGPGANVPRFDEYTEGLRGRGMDTPAEREFLRKMMPDLDKIRMIDGNPMMPLGENIANQVGSPEVRGAMGAANAMGAMGEAMTPPVVSNMGGMTPAEREQYFQSFDKAGINLTPGAGIARGLRGIDQAVTNATTAPGNLGVNQLSNIATGNAYNAQGQINPYSLGLGQQMYMNPMGLLNY